MKRYQFYMDDMGMNPQDDGDYVLYSDALAAQAADKERIKKLEEALQYGLTVFGTNETGTIRRDWTDKAKAALGSGGDESAGEDVKASPVVPVEKLEALEDEFRSMHQVKGKESAAGAGFVTAMRECADRIAQLIKEAKGG